MHEFTPSVLTQRAFAGLFLAFHIPESKRPKPIEIPGSEVRKRMIEAAGRGSPEEIQQLLSEYKEACKKPTEIDPGPTPYECLELAERTAGLKIQGGLAGNFGISKVGYERKLFLQLLPSERCQGECFVAYSIERNDVPLLRIEYRHLRDCPILTASLEIHPMTEHDTLAENGLAWLTGEADREYCDEALFRHWYLLADHYEPKRSKRPIIG